MQAEFFFSFFVCIQSAITQYQYDLQWFWLLRNKPQSVTFQMRPTSCISSKWHKNSMQFTLGMPFLAVLGKFYRNLKGLKWTFLLRRPTINLCHFNPIPLHQMSCNDIEKVMLPWPFCLWWINNLTGHNLCLRALTPPPPFFLPYIKDRK